MNKNPLSAFKKPTAIIPTFLIFYLGQKTEKEKNWDTPLLKFICRRQQRVFLKVKRMTKKENFI